MDSASVTAAPLAADVAVTKGVEQTLDLHCLALGLCETARARWCIWCDSLKRPVAYCGTVSARSPLQLSRIGPDSTEASP